MHQINKYWIQKAYPIKRYEDKANAFGSLRVKRSSFGDINIVQSEPWGEKPKSSKNVKRTSVVCTDNFFRGREVKAWLISNTDSFWSGIKFIIGSGLYFSKATMCCRP